VNEPAPDDIELAAGGDRQALERVLLDVRDDVHRLCLRMTGCPDDALDATQEVLIKVMTRLAAFRGESSLRTWVHRIAVNHLLDRKRSTVERMEMTFSQFADDLLDGLSSRVADGGPEREVLASEVKHGCTLALLTCLDRPTRVAYVLGEVFGVSSAEGARICEISEATYRKRLSRARAAVRAFVAEHCGLVAPDRARCHCGRRVDAAIDRGRIDPSPTIDRPTIDAAVAEMEAMYDAAGLVRSVPDAAPAEVAVRIRAILGSGRYPNVGIG
jgi:RNA polymerase sigma factor (sigma-70 family)